MRILFILSEIPYPASRNGIALINYQLLIHAPSDSQIDLLITSVEESSASIDELRALAPAIGRVYFTSEPLTRKYRVGNLLSGALLCTNLFSQRGVDSYIRNLDYLPDIIYAAPLMVGFNLKLARPIFLNAIDSFARLNETTYLRTGHWRDWVKMKLYRLYERRALTTVNMINLVSSVDFYSLSREAPELPLINICNGVDSSKFTPDEVCRIPGRLLFTGNFEYAPNAEAARHLALYILPQIRRVVPSATLQIVGRNPPPEIIAQPGVIATGFVEDITSCYRNSQVFVCFLLSGAGVKNKVLEAMSSGLPVVTTQLGIDGIDHLEVGRHYLLANDAQSYVQLVVDALGNQNLRNYLAQEARVVMAKHFSWSIIAKRYYTAFGLLAESPG